MHREVQNILKEIRGINLEMLECILKEKNPNIKVSLDDTLSLKQTVYVYEYAKARGFKIVQFVDVVEDALTKPVQQHSPQKTKINHKHANRKKLKVDYSDKKVLQKWIDDFWDRAFASERKQYDNAPPRKGEAGLSRRAAMARSAADRRMAGRGPNAHFISIPMGGKNKKY